MQLTFPSVLVGFALLRLVECGVFVIDVYFGTGASAFCCDNSPATSASMKDPNSVLGDLAGNIYVSDGGDRIRRIDAISGLVNTYAGLGTNGVSGDGLRATSGIMECVIIYSFFNHAV